MYCYVMLIVDRANHYVRVPLILYHYIYILFLIQGQKQSAKILLNHIIEVYRLFLYDLFTLVTPLITNVDHSSLYSVVFFQLNSIKLITHLSFRLLQFMFGCLLELSFKLLFFCLVISLNWKITTLMLDSLLN